MTKLLAPLIIALSLASARAASAQGSDQPTVDASLVSPSAPGERPATAVPTGAPTVVIDPTHPVQTINDATALIKDQGWVWGLAAVLLALGTFLAHKNDDQHWIHNNYVISGATMLLTTGSAALNAHFGSASWASVLTVFLAGIALMWKKPEPKPAA